MSSNRPHEADADHRDPKLADDPLLTSIPEVEGQKILEPCVLYAKVGEGGMGAVYRGRHLNLEVDVAIKCLKHVLAEQSPNFITRFQREARIAASVHHQNLVQVYDISEKNGVHYLVMEYVRGETSRERVSRKGPLKEREAARILLGAASGLAEAHENKIVHRDIKPDNILISYDGKVKVSDLGLAKALEVDAGPSLTVGVMGTPQYMAPEQWDDANQIGPEADVWAMGATLYFLLTGEHAIPAGSMQQVYRRVCVDDFPDVKALKKNLSPQIVAILQRCVSRDPKDRYPNCGALAADLSRVASSGNLDPEDEETTMGAIKLPPLLSPPPAEKLGRIKVAMQDGETKIGAAAKKAWSKAPLLIGGAAVLFIVGTLGWKFLGGDGADEPRGVAAAGLGDAQAPPKQLSGASLGDEGGAAPRYGTRPSDPPAESVDEAPAYGGGRDRDELYGGSGSDAAELTSGEESLLADAGGIGATGGGTSTSEPAALEDGHEDGSFESDGTAPQDPLDVAPPTDPPTSPPSGPAPWSVAQARLSHELWPLDGDATLFFALFEGEAPAAATDVAGVIRWTPVEGGDGVERDVVLTTDERGEGEYVLDVSDLADGAWTVELLVGGATSPASTLTLDRTPPRLTPLRDVEPLTAATSAVVGALVEDASDVEVTIAIGDAEPLALDADPETGAFEIAVPLVEGANAFTFRAVDAAGAETTAELELVSDQTNPVLEGVLPEAGYEHAGRGPIAVTLTFSEPVTFAREGAAADAEAAIHTLELPPGGGAAAILRGTATDRAGRTVAVERAWSVLSPIVLPDHLDAPGWDGEQFPAELVDDRTNVRFLLVDATRDAARYLAATETTQAQWMAMLAVGAGTTDDAATRGRLERWAAGFREFNPENPVVADTPPERAPQGHVDWVVADETCRAVGYALPSRDLWTKACLMGAARGAGLCCPEDELHDYAVFGGGPAAVASKLANAGGFHDMHGNLWEWCAERHLRLGGAHTSQSARNLDVGVAWHSMSDSVATNGLRPALRLAR